MSSREGVGGKELAGGVTTNQQKTTGTLLADRDHIWQPPPQHRGAPQLSPWAATGRLPLPFTDGLAGTLNTRSMPVAPHSGQATGSSERRTSASTVLLHFLQSYS